MQQVESLVEDARSGNRDAFDELVRRYADMAFRYALSVLGDYGLAEDATQEAFVSAYFGLHQLRDDRAFAGWLRGIVRNHALRLLRARRVTIVPLEEAGEVASRDITLQEGVERGELRQGVLAAIMELPESLRAVVTLYYAAGYSQREIAAFLDLPVTTVNNRLHAARRTLKGGLIEMVHDDMAKHGLPDNFTKRVGTIIDARGPVIQVRFDGEQTPRPLDTLTLEEKLAYTVMQRLGNGTVRCLALQSEGDAHSGMAVTDLGRTTDRPVSLAALREAVGILLEGGEERPSILETGIKAIDLLCPLPASGPVGLYGPQGAGKLVVLGELLHRFSSSENRLTLLNFVQADTVDTLPADEPLPNGAGPVESFYLPISDASDPASRAVHAVQDTLAAAIYCSRAMALEALYPAVDPTVSWSRMLTPEIAGEEHVRVAAEARCSLEGVGPDEKGTEAQRARKLCLFLTQPFFTTETFTELPGEYVSLQQTLAGCAAILSGECDDLPEEAFRFTGSIEQVKERASTGG